MAQATPRNRIVFLIFYWQKYLMASNFPTIAVVGGTGKEGSGLALRWAHAGYPVVIGSRSAENAQKTAERLAAVAGSGSRLSAAANEEAVKQADIVVLAVPYNAQHTTALPLREALAGKILVDVTVPLAPPRVDRVQLPGGGSAVAALQAELGEQVRVVSAFQNVSASHLSDPSHPIECDVLICGDDAAACEQISSLASAAGMTGWIAGPLANSAAAEALTSVLIAINKRYKVPGAGLRITGVPRAA